MCCSPCFELSPLDNQYSRLFVVLVFCIMQMLLDFNLLLVLLEDFFPPKSHRFHSEMQKTVW